MLRKFNKGSLLIEVLIAIVLVSCFIILIFKLNYAQGNFQNKYTDKYRMFSNFYNVIQIIKSDPSFYEHIEQYYNINGENVCYVRREADKYYYIDIYFDEQGLLTYQSNACYYVYCALTLNDYTDYYDYYYSIRINISNVINSTNGSKGVYLHYTKNK